MKIPRIRSQAADADPKIEADVVTDLEDAAEAEVGNGKTAYTPPKGRPTPKRNQTAGARGPIVAAPLTRAEAKARKKALSAPKQKQSKEEKRAAADRRKTVSAERRSKMMAGDEKYLPARDRGPVRGYARDLVDSRRTLAGLFLPVAVVMLFTMFIGAASPALQMLVTLAVVLYAFGAIVESYFIGRSINKKVRARFPDSIDGGFKLGFYCFQRSTSLRRWRIPKPRVSPGDAV